MSTRPPEDERIVGGRVFQKITVNGLRTRADAGTSGYTVAHDFLNRIHGKLTDAARNRLAQENIDALGFEVEVDASAGGSPPFSEVTTGLIGISVVWFTNVAQGVTRDPQIYLFTKWVRGPSFVGRFGPLRQGPVQPNGCFFVVNDSGTGPSALGPNEWEARFPSVGAPLLSGGLALIPGSIGDALLYHLTLDPGSHPLFTFGTRFAVVPGEKRPFRITGSTYDHDQWLLERFEFLERPHGQTWTPPPHEFFGTPPSIPEWSATYNSRPRMSLVLSALNEEDDWIKNDNPETKYEEDEGAVGGHPHQKLVAYYTFTRDNSAFNFNPVQWANRARNDRNAWSAVFISYVVNESGVPRNAGFVFSIRHITYIAHACRNRKNSDRSKPFWLYKPDEIDPVKGDIMCMNRGGGGDRFSFEVVRNRFLVENPGGDPPYRMRYDDDNGNFSGITHCDIVVKAETIDGTEYLETIGGNTYDYRARPAHPRDRVDNNVGTVDTVGRKRWKLKDGTWVMVGTDNTELGQGSSNPNEIKDVGDPDDETPTIWQPRTNDVFAFIRDVSIPLP